MRRGRRAGGARGVALAAALAVAAAAIAAPGAPASSGEPGTLHVAVASNFAPALRALAVEHERRTGVRVSVSSGSTGSQFAQIVHGAPFDAVFAADDERPRRLDERGLAVPGTRFTYARGRLVLWSADPALVDSGGQVLEGDAFRRLAIANPRLAPYGRAALEVLAARGQHGRLRARLVMGENVAQAFAFARGGNAELAFVALSQVTGLPPNEAGSRWLVPAGLHAPIEQQAVLLRDTPAGRGFLAFVKGDAGAAIIRAHGYEVPR